MYPITINSGKYSHTDTGVRSPGGGILAREWWESLTATFERARLRKISNQPNGHSVVPEEVPTEGRSILALCDQCQKEGPGKWAFDLRDFPTECEWSGEIRVLLDGSVSIQTFWTPASRRGQLI